MLEVLKMRQHRHSTEYMGLIPKSSDGKYYKEVKPKNYNDDLIQATIATIEKCEEQKQEFILQEVEL